MRLGRRIKGGLAGVDLQVEPCARPQVRLALGPLMGEVRCGATADRQWRG